MRFSRTRAMIGPLSVWYPVVVEKYSVRLGHFGLGVITCSQKEFAFRLFQLGWFQYHQSLRG